MGFRVGWVSSDTISRSCLTLSSILSGGVVLQINLMLAASLRLISNC